MRVKDQPTGRSLLVSIGEFPQGMALLFTAMRAASQSCFSAFLPVRPLEDTSDSKRALLQPAACGIWTQAPALQETSGLGGDDVHQWPP